MADYFDTGFCVRERSWHGKEDLYPDWPDSWDQARKWAGIEWEPETRRMWVEHAVPVGDQSYPDFIRAHPDARVIETGSPGVGPSGEDPGEPARPARFLEPVLSHKAIVRSDTGFHLGTVGADWTPITHTVMGEMVEALLDQPNVKIDTMLSMREGRQVAATILLDEPYTLPGDDSISLPYLALLNAHDGSGACKATRTQVRVVCANTYDLASLEGDRLGAQFIFRHTAGVLERIEEAKAAIAGVRDDAARWQALAEELQALPAPEEVTTRFLSEFIPEPPADVVSDRVRANIAEARSTWRTLYEASPTCAANFGTGLGLVHASVEYLDHLRGYRNRDTLVGRQLLRPEPLKGKAVRVVREVCGAGA